MKVLLVDDDAVQRLAIAAILRKLSFDVTVCKGGPEALTELADRDLQVVVSDWSMPGMDGLELCRRIRSLPRDHYTYFILLSANLPTPENQGAAFAAGADDFLSKPVKADELRIRLHVAGRIIGFVSKVAKLESFLPICGYCKKVRDDANYWQKIEHYIHERTGTDFSHSVCPECYETIVKPQMEALPKAKQVGGAAG